MRHELRISKHDPSMRQSANSSWTSIADVGQTFDDGVLSLEEYERVEGLYLDAVSALLSDAGEPILTVEPLELVSGAAAAAEWIRAGVQVGGAEVLEICRFELREELSCWLSSDRFSIAFGFDYYMYVESDLVHDSTIKQITESGLFVEADQMSPYRHI